MKSQQLTRRQMLQAAAGAGALVTLAGCSSMPSPQRSPAEPLSLSTSSITLDLTGDAWAMHEVNGSERTPAIVPGSTYTDLLRAGKIPDPYYRENNGLVQWVAEKNWIYERTFNVPTELLAKPHIKLQCHGLDTLATIWINGHLVGQTDNMFRAWNFNIKPHLSAGENTLRVRFDTLTAYVAAHREAYQKQYGIDLSDARCWVRKAPYMWGWDWCRAVLTQGIWKPIEIVGFDAQITDLAIFQRHDASGTVHLDIQTTVTGARSNALVTTRVLFANEVVATTSAPVHDGMAQCHMDVSHPHLWWPNGAGEHPLYTVESQLFEATGDGTKVVPSATNAVDTMRRRVGLRNVEVLPPKDGVAMHVRVNGVPVFVKGADWIPADNMPTRVTPEILRWYMHHAVECHFNFIRLWGGGYYEQDELFDLCDELGIMLQFEFKFANDVYPVHDQSWMDNLKAEVTQQVQRCRNHPSIVIWSGNNEIQYFKGYHYLFGDVIGGTVHRLLPGAFYELGSGAAGSGDIHTWEVWFGMKPYSQYRTVEGFVTEFGMQSFPVPATVRAYTDAADRTGLDTPVMAYHETSHSGPGGLARMQHYVHTYFGRDADDFDSKLWLTQLNQAYGIRYGVEHWRRDMPHSMAATIWQYNDCWPAPTWSMTDYYRRYKALQYQSKHFFAPILVSGIPDTKTAQAELHITSDRQTDVSGQLRWCVTDSAGTVLTDGEIGVKIPARTSRVAHTLDLADLIHNHGMENILIWPQVRVGSRVVTENVLFFGRPVELKLNPPQLTAQVTGSGRHYHLQINSNASALWVWADIKDTGATYSDNFINIRPGCTATIDVTLDGSMSPADFHRKLQLRSVYDLAPDMRA